MSRPPATVIPDDTDPEPFEYVMGTEVFIEEQTRAPEKGARYQDPTFKTLITRLTDQEIDGYLGPGIQNEYSRCNPENADGSVVVLRGNSANWYLYRPDTGEQLVNLDAVFNDCSQEPEPRWHHEDPNLFYFLCGPELRSYNISTEKVTTLHDFSEDVGGIMAITTGSEGDASLDRRQWFFFAVDDEWSLKALISYDLENDRVLGLKKGDFPDKIDSVTSDMSGRHAVVSYDSWLEAYVFAPDLKSGMKLAEGSNGHADCALLPDGTDVLVYQNVRNDHICMSDLETGEETQLIEIPFGVNYDIGLHISGNCAKTPGWVLVSTYGSLEPPPDQEQSWMDEQLFMLELAESPRVWRLAHTHCYTSVEENDEKVYFAEAFATITESGRRVYFGSNWGDIELDYSDAYMLTMPEGWYTGVPQ